MPMNLNTQLLFLIPRAIEWAESVAAKVEATGVALTATQIADAKTVGVQQPEKIRIAMVTHFPLPEDAELRAAAEQLGFFSDNMAGLTLGHAILIREGYLTRPLLSHECRHVQQFEQAGSIAAFLPMYLSSIILVGYEDCPFEQDARMHELL